jgi:hypothetical protein
LKLAHGAPPPPRIFVSADSKGVRDASVVSADCKGVSVGVDLGEPAR